MSYHIIQIYNSNMYLYVAFFRATYPQTLSFPVESGQVERRCFANSVQQPDLPKDRSCFCRRRSLMIVCRSRLRDIIWYHTCYYRQLFLLVVYITFKQNLEACLEFAFVFLSCPLDFSSRCPLLKAPSRRTIVTKSTLSIWFVVEIQWNSLFCC